jgi:Thiol-disulfide isomerase and thioredoxins
MKQCCALLLFLSILFSFALAESPQEAFPILADFATTDLDGNAVDETVLSNHTLTMVNIWGTFCNPCIAEMPGLGEIHAELSEQAFQIIGLAIDVQDNELKTVETQIALAKEIISQTKAEYRHLVPSLQMYQTFLAQVTAVPCTFFVDASGNLTGEVYYGSRTKAQWLEIILPLLNEVAP